MSKRVLLAGLFHETHTFVPGTTGLDSFEVRRGEQLLATRGDGSPLGAAVEVAEAHEWELLPVIDLRATPSAIVADEVLECFWTDFSQAARAHQGKIDGILLILHGAMACESFPDAEGEVLERIANLQLGNIPLFGVLDLHANVSQRMTTHSHALIGYRENPHIDAAETATRSAELLDRCLTDGNCPKTLWQPTPIVWPPTGVGTSDDPMRTLESMARSMEAQHPAIAALNVFAGYSFADTPDTGVSFSAVTFGDEAVAAKELQRLADWAIENRALGNKVDTPIDEVMPDVLAAEQGPVVIVEPADNIGGGAPGDETGVLDALLRFGAENAAVVINDPAAVKTLHQLEPGAIVTLSIGAHTSDLGSEPLELEVQLVSKSDGKFDLEDRHSHLASIRGIHIDMGPAAVVQHRNVRILLTTHKTPPFDLGQLRSQGIEPEKLSVIGVKAAVAHRRAYEPIQAASFTVDTPGTCSSNLKRFPFKLIRRPVYPLDEI